MKKLSAALLATLFIALGPRVAGAAATDIATAPVMNITGTGSIKPNVMLMLDDSGSTAWDYTPDQVNDNNKCFDGAACALGYPPYFAPEFNYQYYSPDITYTPGVNSLGASFGNQTTFTAVKTDPYGVQQRNQAGTSMTTENLLTNYPDVVYCSVSSPTAAQLIDGVTCKKNYTYLYPDPAGGTFTTIKSVKGGPYYYRISASKYCSDANLTTCINATAPTGSYINPAPVRWCTSATSNFAYTSCSRIFDSTHTTPEFVGTVKPPAASAAAYGVVSVVTAGSQYSINDMKVDGVSIINTTVTGTSAANFATNLATAINSSTFHSTPEYSACVGARKADVVGPPLVSGDNQCTGAPNTTVTIFRQTAACGSGSATISGCTAEQGTINNGLAITYAGPNVAGIAATGTITVGPGSAGTFSLGSVLVGATTISTGAITLTDDLSTAAGQQAAAAAIAARIGAGYTATSSGNVVTITATTSGTGSNGVLSVTSGAARGTASLAVGSITKNVLYGIDSLSVGGTLITTGPISVTSGSNTGSAQASQDVAAAIAAKIGANGYTASAAGGVVTITAPAGSAFNGLTTSLVATSGIRAAGTLTVNAGSAGSQTYTISNVKAGATTISTAAITFIADLSTLGGQQTAAAAIAANIGNGFSATAPGGGVVNVTSNALGTAGNLALTYSSPAAVQASGSITVSAGAAGTKTYQLSNVSAGGNTLSSGTISFSADLSTSAGRDAAATAIANNIGNGSAFAGGGTNKANLKAPAGLSGNGALTLTGGTVASLSSGAATMTVSGTGSNHTVPTVKVGTTTVVTGGANCSSSSTSAQATCIVTAINGAGTGFTATQGSGGSANVVTIVPNTFGTYANGGLTVTNAGGNPMTIGNGGANFLGGTSTPITVTTAAMSGGLNGLSLAVAGLSGGVNAPTAIPFSAATAISGGKDDIPVASVTGIAGGTNGSLTAQLGLTNFANGIDGNASPIRMNVGTFTRTDIVPCPGGAADPCYPVAATRTDCAAATGCTYNEEMINFSNWYAYYRTRAQTLKSAASLAFNSLGANYRVGFSKLSQIGYSPFSVAVPPSDFNATQRASWYSALFAATQGVSTPLRTALDNLGKMYANQSPFNWSGAARVIQYPCQQNFVIMTTDGLWNQAYSGSVVNNDNVENAERFCTKAGGCFDGITSSPTVPSLADVALYWYNGGTNTGTVSLRPDLEPDVSVPGVVPAGVTDPNTHLHMSTFTLGLGVDGYMKYESNYDKAPIVGGDYYKLITGAGGCSWNGSGTYVWPNPVADTLTAVDDLWHAAVNGHGKYFSARSPAQVVAGLSAAIAAMAVRTGAASAAATSTPNVSQQDNDIFSATFTTVKWYGELFDQKIDPATGNVGNTNAWSSTNTLGTKVTDSTDTRVIKMLDTGSASPALKDFLYSNLYATEKSWFGNKGSMMVQYGSLSNTDRALVDSGTNLVNWLRGQTQYANDEIYRSYTLTTIGPTTPAVLPIVLGDIDTAKPAYLRDARKSYTVNGYDGFVATQKTRAATVFAAANDGMLHAFDATNGNERWAYAPRITMPKLWKQAATDYGSNHQFSTDGSPEIADVFVGGAWKSLLVAGLNAGGRGYYALDVTNPNAPEAMWEFCADPAICSKSDPDVGLTFGNPQIGFWNNKWVVMVATGYNNIPGIDGVSSGSGIGYLYVLDAATGTVLKKISTTSGDATTPSGLAKITAITANPQTDPNITYVYGGDNNGDLWRFDFTGDPALAIPVLKMATLGSAQPITTRPDVSLCTTSAGLKPVVLLGTGRLLGVTDTTTVPATQSVYVVKDSGTALGNLRTRPTMVKQTMSVLAGTGGVSYTLVSPQPVNLTTKDGWYTDLTLNTGERVNLDPKVVFTTAVVVTNLPTSASACTVGGTSYNYQFNLCSGSYVDTTNKIIGGVLSNT
ncbi:MAG: PilC/PilY family type IV pilus protein, partial [Proteobacteria bacterium]|nr:PilC/PilY family type IV pilus protein [Pseudomonadota bacterium]